MLKQFVSLLGLMLIVVMAAPAQEHREQRDFDLAKARARAAMAIIKIKAAESATVHDEMCHDSGACVEAKDRAKKALDKIKAAHVSPAVPPLTVDGPIYELIGNRLVQVGTSSSCYYNGTTWVCPLKK